MVNIISLDSQSGYETFVYQPTPIQTRAMGIRNNDTSIFFIGSVDKLESKDRMIEIYQKMAKALNTDKFLVIGPVSGDTAKVNEYIKPLLLLLAISILTYILTYVATKF